MPLAKFSTPDCVAEPYRRPILSTRDMEMTTPVKLTNWLITVIVNGSTEPRDLIHTVPYLLAKMLPVSWRKKLTPTVIIVLFRFIGFQRSMKVPFSSSSARIMRSCSNSSSISLSVKRPSRSLCSDLTASSSRPFQRSHRGDYRSEVSLHHHGLSRGGEHGHTSGMNQIPVATIVGMMKKRPNGICHCRLSSIPRVPKQIMLIISPPNCSTWLVKVN